LMSTSCRNASVSCVWSGYWQLTFSCASAIIVGKMNAFDYVFDYDGWVYEVSIEFTAWRGVTLTHRDPVWRTRRVSFRFPGNCSNSHSATRMDLWSCVPCVIIQICRGEDGEWYQV
jgi:hypothetical protein